ncbi:unnamed protein product [Psylliodes chrysocephalus]|uniref:Uncharacterized protein n=1 Tax=Psylliodes chrysocephalus TaxID=3402493 RepID=A0A9P0GLG0_9CUCU|nr:unnamed protein product [Psylliodes chrysocephala]
MHAINTMCEELEILANVRMDTTDQHVDVSEFRVKKDAKDIKNFLNGFHPFPEINKILSIVSGVVGGNNINCHKAYEVGITSMFKMIGQTFNNIKLKRSEKVRIGLLCSPACTNCQSQSCSNVIDEDSCDIEEETADSSSVEQFMDIQPEEEKAKK